MTKNEALKVKHISQYCREIGKDCDNCLFQDCFSKYEIRAAKSILGDWEEKEIYYLEEACRQMFGPAECPLCKKRGKTWEGDDPVCALKNGKFSDDNWNCATMNKLREIAIRLGLTYRDDIGCGSCGVVPFEGEDYSGFIVMTWYKERGRTKNAIFLSDDRPIGEIDLKTALDAIQYWEALC